MKKIFIGCSSSNELQKKYYDLAREVALQLQDKYNLVLGGNEGGMMKIIYDIFSHSNNKINIIVAKAYNKSHADRHTTKTVVYHSTERTIELIKCSDIILFLPGGIGTYTEIFSAIEEKRTNELTIPIIIYNYQGYYDSLIGILNNLYQNKFNESNISALYEVVTNLNEIN
ncbi:MAG: LOG family protein [bacterium]|nr:LOG family protein [bacterium]